MDAPILIPVAMMAGFIILGVILSMGKCSFLIAGYNMMSKEQKKQYDERALCRFCLLYTSPSPRDCS